jgi:hypothetical protein
MYVCVNHGLEFKIVENGVIAEQLDDNGDPYKVYRADKWACPECGIDILVLAPLAVAEHWQQGYSFYANRIEVRFSHNVAVSSEEELMKPVSDMNISQQEFPPL